MIRDGLGDVARLESGTTVSFCPRGNSMKGRIDSGQLCTVAPVDPATLAVGDMVLCRVQGAEYLHLVKATHAGRFQIGDNRGRIKGWIGAHGIFGRCVKVADWGAVRRRSLRCICRPW